MEMETKTGTIVNMQKEKGYGFIKQDEEESSNIFFHASRVISPRYDELKENDRVEYLIAETEKGLQAVDVVACN